MKITTKRTHNGRGIEVRGARTSAEARVVAEAKQLRGPVKMITRLGTERVYIFVDKFIHI